MIVLIKGYTHAGKTLLAQRILEKYKIPYHSIDHLKMGLIRSGYTTLTPVDDDDVLTDYLWPIEREMIRTAIENDQHMTIEGIYIPFNWASDFSPAERAHIRAFCLVLTEDYIRNHFDSIRRHSSVIEKRLDNGYLNEVDLVQTNSIYERECEAAGTFELIRISHPYRVDITLPPQPWK